MLNYFSAALADNTSQDIQNHVDDVVLLRAEILEVWTEQARQLRDGRVSLECP